MSPLSKALHARFDEVCRAELARLQRKTAALAPDARAEVDAITVQVMRAIADRLAGAVEAQQADDLTVVVARLFAVPAER